MPGGKGPGFGNKRSFGDVVGGIVDRFRGRITPGADGPVYHNGGWSGGKRGIQGNDGLRRELNIGGVSLGEITTDGNGVRVRAGQDVRQVQRGFDVTTQQIRDTAQGIDDIKTGRYDVGRAEYRDEPRDTSRRGKRNSGPEQYEQDYLRQSGEIAPDDAAPQVTKPPVTPKELEAAQQQGGAFRPAPSATEVRTTDVPASGAAQTSEVQVQTGAGTVAIPKDNPSGAKFEPAKPATQIAGIEIKSGEPFTTEMANKLSVHGIYAETRVGQQGDATKNILSDAKGNIIGGYTSNADGSSQNLISREDLATQLAAMGKDIGSMEKGIRMARGIDADGVKLAATNAPPPAVDPLTKSNNLALNAAPPTTGMG